MSEPEPVVAAVSLSGVPSYAVTVEVSNCASAMADYLHLSLDPVRRGLPVLLSLEGHDADLLIAALLAWRQERGR